MDAQTNKTTLGFTEGSAIGLIIGGLIGSLITYFAVKKKFEKKADKEIEEVRETYSQLTKQETKATEEPVKVVESVKHVTPNVSIEHALFVDPEEPHAIPMELYISDDDYDKETLIYYEEDEVLTDQFDHVLDVNDVIGRDSLDHFGEEDEDILYVRNKRVMTDYEVILEHRASPPTALAEGDEDDD